MQIRADAPIPTTDKELLYATVYCPSLAGLTATQVDMAIVMPNIDHNRAVRETPGHNQWAALLACDPFGAETALLSALSANNYRGVVNWPSTIVFEGETRQSMATIPATPELEYAFLARAADAGFESFAIFLSLEQGKQAIAAGLRHLVLHPGLFEDPDEKGATLIRASLQAIVNSIRGLEPEVTILAFTSDFHEKAVQLRKLDVDGFLKFEASK